MIKYNQGDNNMRKPIEITHKVVNAEYHPSYSVTMKFNKKNSITFVNDMDGDPKKTANTDTCWQFRIFTDGNVKFRVKDANGVIDKKNVVRNFSSTKTIWTRDELTLGFEPPKLENGKYDDEMTLEYLYAICGCYDVKKSVFDMQKALDISKKFNETARDLDEMRKDKKYMAEVKQKMAKNEFTKDSENTL